MPCNSIHRCSFYLSVFEDKKSSISLGPRGKSDVINLTSILTLTKVVLCDVAKVDVKSKWVKW